MVYNIGAKIQLEGEKEYRQQLKYILSSQTELASQMKKLTAEFGENADSVEYLSQKQEILTNLSDEHQKKINLISDRLKKAEKQYKQAADSVEQYKKELEQAEKALEEMRKTGDASADAIEEQKRKISTMRATLSAAEKNSEEMAHTMTKLRTSLNEAETAAIKTNKEISDLSESMEDTGRTGGVLSEALRNSGIDVEKLDGKFGDLVKKIDKAGEQGGLSGDLIKEGMEGIAAAGVASLVVEIEKLIAKMIEAGEESKENLTLIQEALGLTDEQTADLRNAAQNIYTSGFGQDMESVYSALKLVYQYTGEIGKETEEVAKQALAFEKIFGVDVSESVLSATALMENFGLTSEEAFTLMRDAIQKGANRTGDLMDTIKEYAPLFEQAGFSAQEFVGILASGAESGAYSVDAVADAVKEFYVRAREGSDEYKDALRDIGVNSESAVKKLTEGGEASVKTFEEIVTKLEKTRNAQDRATAAAELFGSKYEDLGEKVILSLDDVDTEIGRTGDTINDTISRIEAQTEYSTDRMERKFSTVWQSIAEGAVRAGDNIRNFIRGIGDGTSQLSLFGNLGKGFASGTPSADPGIHPVAEEGPELVTRPSFRSFSGGERVYTAGETQRILQSTASGSTVYNIYITADISQLDDVKQLVESAKRQQLNARSR